MPGVIAIVFDQCRTGLVTAQGGIIRKPTELVSNSEELLTPFIGLTCRGDPVHVELAGSAMTTAAQVWTWDLSQRIVSGIIALKRQHLREIAPNRQQRSARLPSGRVGASSYPSVATSSADGPSSGGTLPPAAAASSCDACRYNRVKTDPTHTRVSGQCRDPHV